MTNMTNIDDFTVIGRLDSMCSQFTKTDWKIAHYLKENSLQFLSLSAIEIANELKTSDASVIRFAQKIGFSGLYELKLQYKKELALPDNDKNDTSLFQREYLVAIQRLFDFVKNNELTTFQDLLTNTKIIYICAFKQHHALTSFLADKFLLLGIKIFSITSLNELKLHSLQSNKDELYIVINVNDLENTYFEYLQSLSNSGSKIVTISDLAFSKKNVSDIHFTLPKTTDLFSGYAISFDSLFMVFIDILFNEILNSNIEKYGINLIRSIELTKPVDDNDLHSAKNKIQKLIDNIDNHTL